MARVRLRSRSARGSRPIRPLPADWVQPRGSGRWTTVGNLDSVDRAAVDPAGLVTLDGRTWSLDWWVGAEDRWHLPSQEVAVRQALVGNSPVVETRLRVPSGDAVHRAYGARNQDGDEAVVVEVENQSKVPFAVALAVRPHDQLGRGAVSSVALDGPHLEVDGTVAVVLPRSPGRMALVGGRDAAAVVMAGEAEPVATTSVDDGDGRANGALLFPLAHTATLRVVLPLGGSSTPDPASFPGPQDVASGWSTQAARGTRVEVPDRRLRDAVAASTRHLLLGERRPEVLAALDLMGFADEARRDLVEEAHGPPQHLAEHPGLGLATLVRHFELTRDVDFAATVAPLAGALLARLARAGEGERRRADGALPGLIVLLEAAGEGSAAADVRALVTATDPELTPDGGAELNGLLGSATGTWTWPAGPGGERAGHDPAANAALVTLVRSLLLAERPQGLDLAPSVPGPWLGQGWELHGAPTRHGTLSYAVRWHGDRPALLWELDRHDPAAPVRLAAPGLDAAWASTDPQGEALLAPVVLPAKAPRKGITMPVTIEPMLRRSDG